MRSRNIKPGFFKNDILAEIEPLGRILFTGLWCMADREGRLENRPKKIKAEVLPYDNCNMTKLLRELSEKNFIIQYSVNGCNYIQIVNFLKHQSPHINEAASTIPAPDLSDTSMIQKHLIPDSFNLIPDSSTDMSDSGSPPVHKPVSKSKLKKSGNSYSDDFERFWDAIIHRPDDRKDDAYKHWKKKTNIPPIDELLIVVEKYNARKQGTDPEHILATYNWIKNQLYLPQKEPTSDYDRLKKWALDRDKKNAKLDIH